MSDTPSAQPPRWRYWLAPGAIGGLLVAMLWARAGLLTRVNVNWDEFYFLSKIHAHARGEVTAALLTFHVHPLFWIRWTSDNEVDQALVLRGVMYVLSLGGVAATIALGARLLGSITAGIFAAFAAQSFSLVLHYGHSARFDPLIVNCFLISAALIVSERRRPTIAAGVMLALAVLFSIKAAFFLPTAALLFALRPIGGSGLRAAVREAAVFAAAFALALLVLGGLHVASLAPVSANVSGISTDGGGLGAIASKTFRGMLAFPHEDVFYRSVEWDWMFWRLLGVAAVLAVGLAIVRRGAERMRILQALAFILPLFAVTFYRNSYPYFYVTIIPPAALVVGVVAAQARHWLRRWPVALAAVLVLLALPMVRTAQRFVAANDANEVRRQRALVRGVHQVFPHAVPYVDRCAMIGSFPKVGPFISTWTIEEYREKGQPIMRALLSSERPQFLLQNVGALRLTDDEEAREERLHMLLPPDFEVLQKSFIPHWGRLWVAGMRVEMLGPETDTPFDVVIAGRYRVEAATSVQLDTKLIEPGGIVELSEGGHTVRGADAAVVTFRTAEAGPPPTMRAPKGRVFSKLDYREHPRTRKKKK